MESDFADVAIGVDVGATKIAAALVTREGKVLASRQAPTGAGQGEHAVLDRIAAEVDALAGEAGPRLRGVGIGTPGQVVSDQGLVLNAVNLGWKKVALVQEIRSRLANDLPVWIQKDANASALGEYYYGAARGCKDFVYLGVGSGLGGGVMAGGRLVTGSNWNAAEVGHLSLDPGGLPCACGLRGCAETLVSGPGLVAVTRRLLAGLPVVQEEPELHGITDLSPARILAAAQAGDRLAQAALAEVGGWLGQVAAACVALLNPASIVIGGGLGAAAFDYLAPAVRLELTQRTLPASSQELHLAPSRLKSSAVGAACLVWYGRRMKVED